MEIDLHLIETIYLAKFPQFMKNSFYRHLHFVIPLLSILNHSVVILFKVPFRHNSPCRGGVGSIGWMILRTMMVVGMQERRQLIYKLSRQSNFTKFLHACSIKWKKIGRSFIISWIIYGPKSNIGVSYY